MANYFAQFTPTGMPLHDYSRCTPSGYPFHPSDESDEDMIVNTSDSWNPCQRRVDLEIHTPEEKERFEALKAGSKEFEAEMALLTRRERMYMLNSLPGRVLNRLSTIPGWKEDLKDFKEACFRNGRMAIVEKMKRHMARAAKRAKK